jgi:hypothetical protein
VKLPFDDRNREDYIAISERLQAGLARISDERTESGGYEHAASSKVLAQLAGCSVATIYARQGSAVVDPIANLRSIKAARLEEQRRNGAIRNPRHRISKEHLRNIGEHIEANEKLRANVKLALDEATRWNHLHSALMLKHRTLTALNNRLVEKIVVLETRITDLTQQGEGLPKSQTVDRKSPPKVTPIVRK